MEQLFLRSELQSQFMGFTEEACKWMRSILEYADIVKVSEEEIELLTGYTDVRKAAETITEYAQK